MSDPPAMPPPSMVVLLVCDQVIDDRRTNKKSAIGLFNTVVVQRVPVRLGQMAVLVTLTEIRGATPLELRLVFDRDNRVLLRARGEVNAPNPLAMVDLVFTLRGVQLPELGQYAFELLSGPELLGRRRFHVLRVSSKQDGPADAPGPG